MGRGSKSGVGKKVSTAIGAIEGFDPVIFDHVTTSIVEANRGGGLMLDTFFWYTGLATWILIVFDVVLVLVVNAHDRSVMRRGEHLNRR